MYICFIDKQARGKQTNKRKHSTGQSTRTRPATEELKHHRTPHVANDSDVWLTPLFTAFAEACPFSTQHSALSCLYSLARLSGVLPGPSRPGSRPPLEALSVCVCVCAELAHGLLVKVVILSFLPVRIALHSSSGSGQRSNGVLIITIRWGHVLDPVWKGPLLKLCTFTHPHK